MLLGACSKSCNDAPGPRTAPQITEFILNPSAPWSTIVVTITQPASGAKGKITFTLPPGLSPSLAPVIKLSDSNAKVLPDTGVQVDFSNSVTYTVTAQDGTTSVYETELKADNSFAADTPTPPQYLAIYNGWPSYVNGLGSVGGSVTAAAAVFYQFNLVVFGNGLQDPSHLDYQKSKAIITLLKQRSIQVFGYVSVRGTSKGGMSDAQLAATVDAWQAMGVTGIYADEYDSSHDATRTRQNTLVSYVHTKGMPVFANGGNVEEALGGSDCLLDGAHGDYYLLESFLYGNGLYGGSAPGSSDYTSLEEWKRKADRAYYYKKTKGVRIACVATTPHNQAPAPATVTASDGYKMSWHAAFMYGFDAYQFTDKDYSSPEAILRFYPNPAGTFGTSWQQASYVKLASQVAGTSRYERSTNTTTTFYFSGNGTTTGTGGH